MMNWKKYKIDIPEMEFDNWSISHFEEYNEERLTLFNIKNPSRPMFPGKYTRLSKNKNKNIIMSDTYSEIIDLYPLFNDVENFTKQNESCKILISGLGLGIAVQGCFINNATHITVIEKSLNITLHIGSKYKEKYKDKIEIINEDIFKWEPPENTYYDFIWHDIWPTISLDNLKQIYKLHDRFKNLSFWQKSWCENLLYKMTGITNEIDDEGEF
jgi:hypothetical protein